MALNHAITFIVDKSLEPFKDKVKVDQTRNIFADHSGKEELLDEKHKPLLPNYQALKDLGPHHLLAIQTDKPKRWVNIRIEVKDKESTDWITLILREDNLYCNGFTNEHNSYELLVPWIGERQPNLKLALGMRPSLLGSSFIPLEWDVGYRVLFGCNTNDELNEELQKIAENPDFVVDGVCFLSKYQHKTGHEADKEEEANAKKYLGGIIFMLIERLRMDMDAEFMGTFSGGTFKMVTGIQKAQIWGVMCIELLKWRDRGFTEWISDPNKKTKTANRLREAGIYNEEDAMKLISLVLNRSEDYYSHLEENKPKPKGPKPKGPDKGGGSQDREDDCEGKGSQDKVDDSKGRGSHEKGDDSKGKGSHDKADDGKGAQDGDDGNSLSYNGRCRLQLLALSANFSIDGINLYDWHRGQVIYRRHLVNQEIVRGNHGQHHASSSAIQEQLVLIGPERAISTYGTLGLQIFRSTDGEGRKRKRTTTQRNPPSLRVCSTRVWDIHNSDDDKPKIHHHDFSGDLPNEKVSITYMVIPNTIEARVVVDLLLRDYKGAYGLRSRSCGGGYDVCGTIKAYAKEMKDWSVELLSTKRKSFKVPCGKKTQIPIVSLVCLPGEDLEISVHLVLKPSVGQEEEIGPYWVKFNPSVKTQQLRFEGHTVEIGVHMRT